MSKSTVFCICCAVVALLVCGIQANAAQPSAAKMSQMGLSGATVVSDSLAMDVRGFGYRGGSRSTIWGRSSIEVEIEAGPVEIEVKSANGYRSTQRGTQIGANVSVVGAAIIGGGGAPPPPPPPPPPEGVAAFNNQGGGGGAVIIFAGGASGVWVPRGNR
jgi:hypothetical protein